MAEIVTPSLPVVRRPPARIAVAALVLALVVAAAAILAGFGSRWGVWNFRFGFRLLGWAAYGGIAVLVLSVVALVLTRPGTPRRGFGLALLALLIGLVVVGVPLRWRRTASGVPPIHDITTDPGNPPQFVAVAPLRRDAPNPIEYGGAEVAAQQRAAYPDIRPLVLNLPPAQAFQRALDTAVEMGWEIVDANAAQGRIEATDRTFWFGFRDDVVIRITPAGGRSILDVRSLSRVGKGDVGTNARRVRAYLEKVQG